jgi:hypothetical protein
MLNIRFFDCFLSDRTETDVTKGVVFFFFVSTLRNKRASRRRPTGTRCSPYFLVQVSSGSSTTTIVGPPAVDRAKLDPRARLGASDTWYAFPRTLYDPSSTVLKNSSRSLAKMCPDQEKKGRRFCG